MESRCIARSVPVETRNLFARVAWVAREECVVQV